MIKCPLGEFFDGRKICKLNTNENPQAFAGIFEESDLCLSPSELYRYSDPDSRDLVDSLARHHCVPSDWILPANGISGLLGPIFLSCLCSGLTRVTILKPNYSLYEHLASQLFPAAQFFDRFPDATVRQYLQFGPSEHFDLTDLDPRRLDCLFLSSPNVPTGMTIDKTALLRWLEIFPGWTFLDEAYAPFAEETNVPWIQQFPRLAILRTFSKSHGLAGLRCGYLIARPELIEKVETFVAPYAVNTVAQRLAKIVLNSEKYQGNIQKIVQQRSIMNDFLNQNGFFVFPSQTNFLLFTRPQKEVMQVSPLEEFMRKNGLLIRSFSLGHYPFLRITIGTKTEMETAREILRLGLKNLGL